MHVRKLTAWSTAAELALASTLGEDRDSIVRGVNEGRLELFEIERGAAHLVTCVDADTRELIVCCAAGRGMNSIADVLWRTARQQQLSGVRFFTTNPAIARLIEGRPQRYPMKLLGYVYRCEVPRVSQ